jgi:BlaI family transcriptional regulator, penicillinase repressor
MPPFGKKTPLRLTAAEIELLKVLWDTGPATIAEVHAAMPTAVGYTTVQTRLNRLVGKRVAGKSRSRPARYRALLSPDDVSRADLNVLVGRVNDGNVVPLVAHLIRDRSISPDELKELRALIDEAERRANDGKGGRS